MSRFAIAAMQLALGWGDNRAAIAAEVAAAVKRFPWVQMLVLPELASLGPDLRHAEPLPGPTEQGLQALAARHGVWLVTGSLYERCGDRIHNTASVIDPQGRVVARHRKLYPFLPYEVGVAPGEAATVFEVPGVGRFGLCICYDGWFPEVARAMAWQGAEVVLMPSMTQTLDRAQELVLAQAQAIAQQCGVVNVNIAGQLGMGRSIVVGPEGEVLYQAGEQREIVPLTLDLAQVRSVRERGTLGLGQVLKSFRDSPFAWPCYAVGASSPSLAGLGPLQPQKPTRPSRP